MIDRIAEIPLPGLIVFGVNLLAYIGVWAFFGSYGVLYLANSVSLMIALLAYVITNRVAPRWVGGLMDFPRVENQYPVRVQFSVNRRRIGYDIGLVTFVDDLLHFEGRQISFDFPNPFIDLGGKVADAPAQLTVLGGNAYALRWSHERVKAELAFCSYHRVPGVRATFGDSLRHALARWSLEPQLDHDLVLLPPIQARSKGKKA